VRGGLARWQPPPVVLPDPRAWPADHVPLPGAPGEPPVTVSAVMVRGVAVPAAGRGVALAQACAAACSTVSPTCGV